MSLSESPRGGSEPHAPLRRPLASRHIRSQLTSYRGEGAEVKRPQPLRRHYPNLSPTRMPSDPSDVALWPSWTKLRVEELDLDQFDADGAPLFEGGR